MTQYTESVVSTAYRIKRTVSGVKCDICGKIVPAGKYGQKDSMYYKVTTGHHDWGNDSVDSIEHMDVCQECVLPFIGDYLWDNSETTLYCDIERNVCWPEEECTFVKNPPDEKKVEL